MKTGLEINVANLDAEHRRALEEVIGHALASNQRLVISVMDIDLSAAADLRPAQTLDDWTRVYEGLSDDDVQAIDEIANTRADLTRDLP